MGVRLSGSNGSFGLPRESPIIIMIPLSLSKGQIRSYITLLPILQTKSRLGDPV